MLSGYTPMPFSAIRWLFIAQWALLLPHFDRVPLWFMTAVAGLVSWGFFARTGRIRLPSNGLRRLILLGLVAVFILQYRGRFSVDTAAAFFILTLGLKWLELRRTKDAMVLVLIQFYLAAVTFLFDQSLAVTIWVFGAIVLLLFGLQNLHGQQDETSVRVQWRSLAGLILKTLPIVVVLFLFFPRLAPLWSVPLVSSQGATGLSERMSPGDFSQLVQSSERVFRASFSGPLPPAAERYWRALILDEFDGKAWRSTELPSASRVGRVAEETDAEPLVIPQYEILQEPTFQRWAFMLRDSEPVSKSLSVTDDDMVRLSRPADTLVRYRLSRHGSSKVQSLSPADLARFTQLPRGGNVRTRAYMDKLRQQYPDDSELVALLLRRFGDEDYHYTLRPPLLGANPIDELLFDTRKGFCAHYASSLTYMLRLAGIPSRVVGGYLGGEAGLSDEYLVVRQYDAHAWVDVWLPARGWVEVDPTAFIAPSRVEQGLRAAMDEEGSFLDGAWTNPERYRGWAAVDWVRMNMDLLNYQWQRWVVGYQGQTQLQVLSRWFPDVSLEILGIWTGFGVAMVTLLLGSVTFIQNWRLQRRSPLNYWLQAWLKQLNRAGIHVGQGVTPRQILSLCGAVDSSWYRANQRMVNGLELLAYKEHPLDATMKRGLRVALRELKRVRPSNDLRTKTAEKIQGSA